MPVLAAFNIGVGWLLSSLILLFFVSFLVVYHFQYLTIQIVSIGAILDNTYLFSTGSLVHVIFMLLWNLSCNTFICGVSIELLRLAKSCNTKEVVLVNFTKIR